MGKNLKKVIFDPPNLSKRSTKSDSRAKVTKGLFIFSPKHGRMQKFTTFYQAGFENAQNFSIFTCMFSSGWGPYPNLKVLLCEKMHDHLVIRCFPARQVFGRLRAGLIVLVSRFVYIKNYLAAPFGHCHNLISSSNHLELKSIHLWNHVVQQRVTTLLNELAMWVFWGTPHTCPNWKKVLNLKVYKFKN